MMVRVRNGAMRTDLPSDWTRWSTCDKLGEYGLTVFTFASDLDAFIVEVNEIYPFSLQMFEILCKKILHIRLQLSN